MAKSLDQLLAEINASAPNRSKVSDGSIGDENHQSTDSDHNPWCHGWVVTARDFTHDPNGGFDSYAYAEWQRQRCRGDILLNGQREIRVKYIISNRRIASPTQNWVWRTYTGSNPHDHHVHVSVDCTPEGGYMDSVTPWGWPNSQEDGVEQADTVVGHASPGNRVGDVFADQGNFRNWWYGSGTNVGKNPPPTGSRVVKLLEGVAELVARPPAVPAPADLAEQIAAALATNQEFLDAIANRVLDKQAQRLQS